MKAGNDYQIMIPGRHEKSVLWLDSCLCTILNCADGDSIVIMCPKHGPTHIRDNLIEQEGLRGLEPNDVIKYFGIDNDKT